MSKALESGKSLLQAVLAKLPENLRAGAEQALNAPEAADALTLLGDSALARSDYSKAMDAIRDKETTLKEQEATLLSDHAALTDWYAPRKALVDKYSSLEAVEAAIAAAKGSPNPNPNPNPSPTSGLSKEDVEKILMERDRGYANVLALGVEVGAKHLHTFGEPPDMRGIIDLATKKGLSMEDAYREKYGDKLREREKAEYDAGVEKRVQERLAEERKKDATQPYPLRNREPSVLDVLSQPDFKSSDFSVDAAVAEYERLQNGSH